jgi:hypothetical protein
MCNLWTALYVDPARKPWPNADTAPYKILLWTNWVVAICVLFVSVAAVGAVGVPVKLASSLSALYANASAQLALRTPPLKGGTPDNSVGVDVIRMNVITCGVPATDTTI